MSPLRILVITRGLPFHALGGMEAVAWDLSRAFMALGSKVTILTTACTNLPSDSIVEGVRIVCLNAPSGGYSKAWWQTLRDAYETSFQMETDVVLSISAGARDLAKRRSGPHPIFLMQAHGTAWGEFLSIIRQISPVAWIKSIRNLLSMWEDRAYRHFDGMIAVGKVLADDMRRHPTRDIIGSVPVHLIENGIAEEVFAFNAVARLSCRAQLNLSSDSRVVFCASRLHPQKGTLEAIEGFLLAAVSAPELHMVIAGVGPDETRLKARAVASGFEDRIHFLGMVPRTDLRDWLSAADVFLFSTKQAEGLPLNILEALATGLPVVASEHVVDPRFDAISMVPDDAADVASGISIALQNTSSDRTSRIPTEFSLNYAAESYIELFKELFSARLRRIV